MTPEPEAAQRLEFLDAIRGIAAVGVLLFHVSRLLPGDMRGGDTVWMGLTGLGSTGVGLFFVASAFSLSYSSRVRGTISAEAFYVRRFFRIAPLYYLLMGLTILSPSFGIPSEPPAWLLNATFTFNLVPGYQSGMVYAGWTIGVEMLFYAVFPLLFVHLASAGRVLLALAGSVALLFALDATLQQATERIFTDQQFPPFYLIFAPRFLPCFLVGLLAYHAALHIQRRRESRLIGMALLLAALLCLAIFYVRWNGTGTADVHREYAGAAILEQSFIFFLFLVGLMNAPVSLLVNSWTAGLGKRSYSLYLLHLPVIMILFPYIGVIRSLELPAGAVFILCATIVLIVAGALSFLSYRFIEKPGMQLGTRLLQRRHRRQEEAKG